MHATGSVFAWAEVYAIDFSLVMVCLTVGYTATSCSGMNGIPRTGWDFRKLIAHVLKHISRTRGHVNSLRGSSHNLNQINTKIHGTDDNLHADHRAWAAWTPVALE
ncbi:hypothetical protein V8F06_007315 [Rhypophila decipiens]